MNRLILPLFTVSILYSAEPWEFDVGGSLQFPMPAGSSELAQNFTPIIGGGGDVHWWFSERWGAGLKFTADYLTAMPIDLDLIELTQLGQVNARISFSEKAYAVFAGEAGYAMHIFHARSEVKMQDRFGPCVGGYAALPMRIRDHLIVGPHAETVIQCVRGTDNIFGRAEWYAAVGVTFSFAGDLE